MKSVDELYRGTAALVDRTTAQLRERNNPDEKIKYGRNLLACALDKIWGEEKDHGRVLQNLDCSPDHLKVAKRMAVGGGEAAEKFRQDLRQILGEPEPVVETVTEPPKQNEKPAEDPLKEMAADPQKFLFRIALEHYGYERKKVLEARSSASTSRRVIAFLAKRAFFMRLDEVADLLECGRDTARRVLDGAEYDYDSDEHDPFRREVKAVCDRYGISFKRRAKSLA